MKGGGRGLREASDGECGSEGDAVDDVVAIYFIVVILPDKK